MKPNREITETILAGTLDNYIEASNQFYKDFKISNPLFLNGSILEPEIQVENMEAETPQEQREATADPDSPETEQDKRKQKEQREALKHYSQVVDNSAIESSHSLNSNSVQYDIISSNNNLEDKPREQEVKVEMLHELRTIKNNFEKGKFL